MCDPKDRIYIPKLQLDDTSCTGSTDSSSGQRLKSGCKTDITISSKCDRSKSDISRKSEHMWTGDITKTLSSRTAYSRSASNSSDHSVDRRGSLDVRSKSSKSDRPASDIHKLSIRIPTDSGYDPNAPSYNPSNARISSPSQVLTSSRACQIPASHIAYILNNASLVTTKGELLKTNALQA